MERKASELMSEPVLAGGLLMSRQQSTRVKRGALGRVVSGTIGIGVGSVAGSVAGGVASDLAGLADTALAAQDKSLGVQRQGPSLPGGHTGDWFFVALGATKLAFFSIKAGFWSSSIDKLLVQHPRGDVVAIDIGGGLIPEVSFRLNDGTNYVLACARASLGNIKKVKKLLPE